MKQSWFRARARATAAAVLAVSWVLPGGALAQGKAKPPGSSAQAAPALDVKALVATIRSGEPAQVVEALGAARDAGAAAAPVARAIEELVGRGATVPVAKAALEALGAIGQTSSSAAIRPYVRHRVRELRREAVKALLETKGAEAQAAFLEGLRSSDATVRGYAATGLGTLDVTAALPALLAALDRDVAEAAAAVGQMCDPATCRKLLERLGKLPFEVMVTGLDGMFFRPRPLPTGLLLEVVVRLRDLGTPEAGKFLADVRARWPEDGSRAVAQALDGAVASIPGARP